jgi:hypothetical protein
LFRGVFRIVIAGLDPAIHAAAALALVLAGAMTA